MRETNTTSQRIFFGLALAATILFFANADGGGGARSLKNFWESRGKADERIVLLPAQQIRL